MADQDARKANASMLATAAVTIGAWMARQWGGVDVPGEVQGAVSGIIGWFAVYYMFRRRKQWTPEEREKLLAGKG